MFDGDTAIIDTLRPEQMGDIMQTTFQMYFLKKKCILIQIRTNVHQDIRRHIASLGHNWLRTWM